MKSIAVLPGDGVGPEVVDPVVATLDKMGLPLEFRYGEIGWKSWCANGDPVPRETWSLLDETNTCLLGAITSKPIREAELDLAADLRGTGLTYVSPVVQLRQKFALYANVRPVCDLLADRFDFVVIRENTEGLYAGLDYFKPYNELWNVVNKHSNAAESGVEGTSVALRVQTQVGMDRLLRFSFEYARANGFSRLTVADKPNVLRNSGQHLRGRLEIVSSEYPEIEAEVLNVDAVGLWMVRRPNRFGVIVAENMFGDIISDVGAGVMGGLGLASSGNIGADGSYFEPVHGSAPGMAGLGRANPMASFLTTSQLLRHLDMPVHADEIRAAVRAVARAGRSVTYDLGGVASTPEVAAAVGASVGATAPGRQASIITVGDELLSGAVADANSVEISAMLTQAGYHVRTHMTSGDVLTDIGAALRTRIGLDDVVFVIGGLGPTSDDVTRDGVAAACERQLEHHQSAWDGLVERLESFHLPVHESNRRQAMFPQDSELLRNERGTAWGARIRVGRTEVVMLPGPPAECLPMAESAIAGLPHLSERVSRIWRLLGVVEGDIAADVDALLATVGERLRVSYIWRYPYVDVTVSGAGEGIDVLPELDLLLAPHTVSRTGQNAFEELATKSPRLQKIDLDFAAAEFDDNLERCVGGRVEDGTALSLVGRTSWTGGPAEYSGMLELTAEVSIADTTRNYQLSLPKRGPEVAEAAAAFFAWSALRALTALEES